MVIEKNELNEVLVLDQQDSIIDFTTEVADDIFIEGITRKILTLLNYSHDSKFKTQIKAKLSYRYKLGNPVFKYIALFALVAKSVSGELKHIITLIDEQTILVQNKLSFM